jgi:serine/threonine protein kinase
MVLVALAFNAPVDKSGIAKVLEPLMLKKPSQSLAKLNTSYHEIKEFKSVKSLGRGSSSIVRLVKHKNSGQCYALKEFIQSGNEDKKTMFKHASSEYCIQSSLEHPNILKCFDLIVDHGHCYELLEFCDGGSLYDFLKEVPILNEEEIQCFFKEIIEGLNYMQKFKVVHHDLKPENILLDKEGHVKIADFGVSEVTDKTGICTSRVGTRPYMAPEEFEKKEYAGLKVDIWSVGIIYLNMRFHSLPWLKATVDDPNYRYYLEKNDTPRHYFRQLEPLERHLILKMLNPNATERIDVSDVMLDPFYLSIPNCTLISRHKL